MITAFQVVTGLKIKTVLGLGLCAAVLAGCGGGSDVAEKIIAGGQAPIEISPETFAPPVPCPPMQLQSNTYLIRKYQRGKENEQDHLLYQATVEDWANSCTLEAGGQRRIKMGFSGDVTPGPAWQGGDIVLPLRVAIVPGGPDAKPLASELLKVPVSLTAGAPSKKWTLIESKFTVAQSQSAKVVFGFDQGRRR